MVDIEAQIIENMREALAECECYFDSRADADCDQDGFIPNAEMRLLSLVRDALSLRARALAADAPLAARGDDPVLPCDVAVAPATIIRKGCNVSTLMLAIKQREGRDFGGVSAAALVALATPAASPATEPVAWRIRIGDSDSWGYAETESDADFWIGSSGRKGVKQPLYTASPSPAPAVRSAEGWRDLDGARLQRAIDAFYEPCEGTTMDGVRNAILAWERG